MGLYRNRQEGWIAGVCAGLADYWNVPNWMVRLATFALFIFTGSLAFWAYVAGIVLLASRRDAVDDDGVAMEYDESEQRYRPKKAFRYSDAPSDRLRRAQERLDAALGKVEAMERYVTSRRYDLNQKFSKL
jgi:phage shock protein C